jgi:hypothetical protein
MTARRESSAGSLPSCEDFCTELACADVSGDVFKDCGACTASAKCFPGATGFVHEDDVKTEDKILPPGRYKDYCGGCRYGKWCKNSNNYMITHFYCSLLLEPNHPDLNLHLLKCGWCLHAGSKSGPQSVKGAFTSECPFVDADPVNGKMACSTDSAAETESSPAEANHNADADAEDIDLMDTAQDMAESMVDVPAKDIKSVDDTTKVLGETVR